MPQRYLIVFRIVMLVIVILLVVNTCKVGYELGMTYFQQGKINFNLEELESKLKEAQAVETDYKITTQTGDWQKITPHNFFAAGNVPLDLEPTKPGEKPPEDKKDSPPKPEETEKEEVPFILVAISVYGDQGKNMAILKNRVTRASYIVEIGEEVNGYKVRAIEGEEVILAGKEEEVILSLTKGEAR